MLGRTGPELPCEVVFAPEEWQARVPREYLPTVPGATPVIKHYASYDGEFRWLSRSPGGWLPRPANDLDRAYSARTISPSPWRPSAPCCRGVMGNDVAYAYFTGVVSGLPFSATNTAANFAVTLALLIA